MKTGEPIHVTKENSKYAHDLIERKLGDFRKDFQKLNMKPSQKQDFGSRSRRG